MTRISAAILSVLTLSALPVGAQRLSPLLDLPEQKLAPAVAPPLRIAENRAILASHSLQAAALGAGDSLAALGTWNKARHEAAQIGFSRPLPEALAASLATGAKSGNPVQRGGGWLAEDLQGNRVWGSSVSVEGSYRLRLELHDVDLPAGARLWVWGEGEEPIAFDASLLADDRTLWTPSVSGPTIFIELSVPAKAAAAGTASFKASRVLELFELGADGQALTGPRDTTKLSTACIVDAACVPEETLAGIGSLRRAMARLDFVQGGNSFLCSGALLNNTHSDGTPYLLTSNRCFSTQAVATTLEAFWDYVDATCGGSAPALATLPRSQGSTLLASSANTDYTFVRLNSAPGPRSFLGWNADPGATVPGTTLFRLSHPLGRPMAFSKSSTSSPSTTCSEVPIDRFLYSDPQPELNNGATFPASGGAPALLATGQLVGQLGGGCGPNAGEPCSAGPQDSDFDGRFSQTYPSLASFLSPAGGTQACVADESTACLQPSGRFEVKVDWQTASASGHAQIMSFGGQRAENNDSAFFWFFTDTNFEMGLKILDACSFNTKFWVFISGLTDQGWTVHIRDTKNGATRTYTNAVGHLTSTTADTSALACP